MSVSSSWARSFACLLAVVMVVTTRLDAVAQEPAGRVVFVKGEVRTARSSEGPWVEAVVGMALMEGDLIATAEGSKTAILLRDETQVQLHGRTCIQIRQVAQGALQVQRAAARPWPLSGLRSLYRLLEGRVWLRAPHPVDWEVGSALVGVRGTDLSLSLDGETGEAVVWVLSGNVQVLHPLGATSLGAMERARMSPILAPRKEAIRLYPAQTVQWVLRHPAWVSPGDVRLEGRLAWPDSLLGAVRARDRGDLDRAWELLEPLPHGPLEELLRAWILMDQGRHEEAEARFNCASRDMMLAWAGVVISLIRRGLFLEAKEAILEAKKWCGEDPLLRCLWGVAGLGIGDVEGMASVLGPLDQEGDQEPLLEIQRALMAIVWNEPQRAHGLVASALATVPNAPTAHLVRAALLRSAGDLEGALWAARKALTRDPSYLPALIQAAEIYWGLERSAEAMELVERALKMRPNSSHALVLRGYMDLSSGESAKAKQAFETALDVDPQSSEAHVGLGILEMREGQKQRALEEFLAASLVEPMASLPLSYLGKALHELGRSEEALGTLARAADLDPRDPTPHLYRALILKDLHRPVEATEALEASMARNQNRSVYRSRFLLDQDRAVRNVNLAEAYRDLGLLARARSHAIVSVREDPTNSSSHLFLSTPFREEGRARAGIRELLMAQMLAPANVNTFNTFHDYTVMFEGSRLQGEVEAGAGQMGLWSGSLFLQGGTTAAAGDLLLLTKEDKGFHGENHVERDRFGRTDWKFCLSPSHEVLLRWASTSWAQGDHNGDADAEWVQDPYLHQRGYIHTGTIGHRWHLGPREELLAYGIWSAQGFNLEDQLWFTLPLAIQAHTDLEWRFRQEHLQAGLLHLGRSGGHRWEWGVHGARGRERLEPWVLTSLRQGGSFLGRKLVDRALEVPTAMAELHAGDIWEVTPGMYLEGSLHFQLARMGGSPPVVSEEREQRASLGPRLGLVWRVGERDLLRAGLAHYLEPPYTLMEGLQPVEVAGFPLGEDSASGSLNDELRLGWDRSWSSEVFTHLGLGLRKHRSWEQTAGAPGFQARDLWDWRAQGEMEVVLAPTLALAGRYSFRQGRWEEVDEPPGTWPGESWAEHKGALELRWVHPAGWKVLLRETAVRQMGELGLYGRTEHAFWTDLEVEKFLWGRSCSVRLVARNLFDQPFRLRTWELVEEKGIPARQISLWVRFLF